MNSRLSASIANDRALHPEDFAALARVRDAVLSERHRARGGRPPVALWLRPFGKRALLPLIEMGVLGEGIDAGADPRSIQELRVGALEALGSLRDPRAAGALRELAVSGAESPEIQRAAVVALGRIGDDESSELLARLAEEPGPAQGNVLAGIGECRRLAVARALEHLTQSSHDAGILRLVARALGEVGSSWAWRTRAVAQSGEGEAVRSLVARALVTLFVEHAERVRLEARKSLLLVAHPSTAELIRSAMTAAAPSSRAELADLLARLERSPLGAGP